MKIRDLNLHLADLLGVPWREQPVTGFDLRVRADEHPRLVVISTPHGASGDWVTQRYELSAIGSTAAAAPRAADGLDIEAMAQAARARLASHIEALAKEQKAQLESVYHRACARMWIVD